ncbi:WD40-repeat-containing domain protein [Massariosphaeria phaeospora]|uniref:WD40-repeat-containing domain protein n=1 Tax=Massariosphaeria phaeospora TaxID=100035 RepID=A0A7C8MH94_9PLEO|nr:WD40-repeat-containing domain protein [Massariosphaeria phaeospora]
MHSRSDLPSLRSTIRLGGKGSDEKTPWFDVKFYPYNATDPIFAVTGGRNTVICRCVAGKDRSIDILRWFEDDEDVTYNSLEWSRGPTGDPLVCLAGDKYHINVMSVTTGQLVTTLSGHGDCISDLAVSPVDPTILVSAAMDHGLRIWSLDPAHRKQPTAAILYGEGHTQGVLTVAFHRKGKYILSGGMDTKMVLWMIPEALNEHLGTDKPGLIHYPLFVTSEVHTDYVDCVRFYNDMILSRSAKDNKIILWSIDNFDSSHAPPSSPPIPPSTAVHSNQPATVPASSVTGTRSAWGGRFQRLLQFEFPHAEVFYIRFGLFHQWGQHPILVAGDMVSCLHFWDLERIEDDINSEEKDGPAPSAVHALLGGQGAREGSAVSNESSRSGSRSTTTTGAVGKLPGKRRGRQPKEKEVVSRIGNPFKSLKWHKRIEVPRVAFTTRQIAWSLNGQWCVAVGDFGMINVMSRWEHEVPPREEEAARPQ